MSVLQIYFVTEFFSERILKISQYSMKLSSYKLGDLLLLGHAMHCA